MSGSSNEQVILRTPVELVDSYNLINDHQIGTSISRKMLGVVKIYPKVEFSLEEVRTFLLERKESLNSLYYILRMCQCVRPCSQFSLFLSLTLDTLAFFILFPENPTFPAPSGPSHMVFLPVCAPSHPLCSELDSWYCSIHRW